MKSAVTVSLVEQARGGPFVYWDGLEDAFTKAQQLGFDAVEIFAPGPDAVDRENLKSLVASSGVPVAAVGTGAGMVINGLSLTDPDQERRQQAIEFVRQMIAFGAEFNAPAIIGSMQGRFGGELDKPAALGLLSDALAELGSAAADANQILLYEPLNRYETNLVNTIADGVELIQQSGSNHVKLLADLFHMNIEETDVAAAIRDHSDHIGHVHFVDSNRWAAGYGHTDFRPIVTALKETGFDGYLAIEAFARPDSDTAAQKSIQAINTFFE
ncbi:MAG: sugar phosphate isomerase/epimerase family protein [Planctomycetota bacterium]